MSPPRGTWVPGSVGCRRRPGEMTGVRTSAQRGVHVGTQGRHVRTHAAMDSQAAVAQWLGDRSAEPRVAGTNPSEAFYRTCAPPGNVRSAFIRRARCARSAQERSAQERSAEEGTVLTYGRRAARSPHARSPDEGRSNTRSGHVRMQGRPAGDVGTVGPPGRRRHSAQRGVRTPGLRTTPSPHTRTPHSTESGCADSARPVGCTRAESTTPLCHTPTLAPQPAYVGTGRRLRSTRGHRVGST